MYAGNYAQEMLCCSSAKAMIALVCGNGSMMEVVMALATYRN
jgi:hypothetical protein